MKTVEERLAALEAAQTRYGKFEENEAWFRDRIVENALQAARVRTLGYYIEDGKHYRATTPDSFANMYDDRVKQYAEQLLQLAAGIPK